MDYIIYTYGGFGEWLSVIFNGIARLFASDSPYFTSVAKFSLGIGAIWAATRAIFHTNIGIFGKSWFFPSFLAFTFLFTPKSTVIIKDEAQKKMYTVANIPFVVAAFSSLPSQISHYLAEEIEDQFKVVGSAKSSHNGVMFGAKLVSKFKDIKVQDPVLLDNAKKFCKQCFLRPWIMGNLLGKRKEAEETDDLISWLKTNKAQNFGFYYRNEDGTSEFKECPEVTHTILDAIEKEAQSREVLGKFGMALGSSGTDLKMLAKRLTETGDSALKSLAKETASVHQWVRQSMMLNVYRESLDDWRESEGMARLWPGIISMNATRGLYQQSLGWMTAGEMAAQFLPLLQTVVFIVIVCGIFVVFPFALLPGGIENLKTWIQGMIWVQTWPVFFAIINCMGLYLLQYRTAPLGDTFGMDKWTQGDYSDMLIHTYAAVQMFAGMVPFLSWMIVSKSGYAFTSMADRLGSSGTGAALGLATADGSLNMNNVSYGNRQLNQQSFGPHIDTSSSLNTGQVRVIQSEEGQTFLSEQASQLATNFRGSMAESASLEKAYAYQSSRMSSLTDKKGELISLEESQLQDRALRWSQSEEASLSENARIAEDMRILASGGMTTTESFSSKDSKTAETSSNIEAHAGGSINIGILKAGADIKTGTAARNTEENSHSLSGDRAQKYDESLTRAREYFKNKDSKQGFSASDSLASNLQNTWREQENVSRDLADTKQNMESIQQRQAYVQTHQSSIDQNWNDQVLEEVQRRENLADKQEALSWMNSHRQETQSIFQGLVDQQYEHLMGKGQIDAEGDKISSQTSKIAEVDYEASKSHLGSKSFPSQDSLKQSVEKDLSHVKEEINQSKNDIMSEDRQRETKTHIERNFKGQKKSQEEISDWTLGGRLRGSDGKRKGGFRKDSYLSNLNKKDKGNDE